MIKILNESPILPCSTSIDIKFAFELISSTIVRMITLSQLRSAVRFKVLSSDPCHGDVDN